MDTDEAIFNGFLTLPKGATLMLKRNHMVRGSYRTLEVYAAIDGSIHNLTRPMAWALGFPMTQKLRERGMCIPMGKVAPEEQFIRALESVAGQGSFEYLVDK